MTRQQRQPQTENTSQPTDPQNVALASRTSSRPILAGPIARPEIVCGFLATISLLGVLGMLALKQTPYRHYGYHAIMVASACYVLIALAAGALRTPYGRSILAGLILCAAGDALGPGNFMLGLVMFLIAHFGFSAAFLIRGVSVRRLSVWLVLALALSGGVFAWLYPHVPARDHLPIYAYMAVITMMMVVAGGARPGAAARHILLGAILFYVSDVCLARSKYVSPGFINTAVGYPLYYAACVVFALSVLKHARESLSHPKAIRQ
jgi:uncharacterized membrane protein YhhN